MRYLKQTPTLISFCFFIVGLYHLIFYPELGEIDFSQINLSYSSKHWLGTDYLGRDLLGYIFKAIFCDLFIAALLSCTNYCIGSFTALMWACLRPNLQSILHLFIVAINSIPKILLIIISMQSSNVLFCFVLLCVVTQWAKFTLIIKPFIALEIQKPHCLDARLNDYSMWHIMYYHLYPHIQIYIQSMYPYSIMYNLSTLTTLRYLGYGFSDHAPSLGHLLAGQKIQPDLSLLMLTFCVYYLLNATLRVKNS
jgi:peptide/nickel transport system permease protein